MKKQIKLPAVTISDAEAKRVELERVLALAGAAENPVWKAVVSYADEMLRLEHEQALLPNLPDSVRQFNCGRSSAAYDFALALRELQRRAELEANKIKGEA